MGRSPDRLGKREGERSMSITALILKQSVAYHAALTARHGDAAARALYLTAARLIAGDYKN